MHVPRTGHAAIWLFNGQLLVTGGRTVGGGITNSAEIFDPLTNEWRILPSTLLDARVGHSLTQLPNGNVLVAGGETPAGPAASLELFGIYTEEFTFAGSLTTPRTGHDAAVLEDGSVLVVGGSTEVDGASVALATTEIYDAESATVSVGPSLAFARTAASATTLLDGRVLIAGGRDESGDLSSAEIYDPSTGEISPVRAPLTAGRSGHKAFLLPHNGSVLLVGGTRNGQALPAAELFLPWSGAFKATSRMNTARDQVLGSPLEMEGRFLAAGMSVDAEMYAFATVTTDKDDYHPGETVHIRGNGWKPGETVRLVLNEITASGAPGPKRRFTALADAFGQIANSQYAPEVENLHSTFFLTAYGADSEAQTKFTDGNVPSGTGTIIVTPGTAMAGTPVTLDFTFVNTDLRDKYPNNSVLRLTIPTGWSAPTTSSVSIVGGTCATRTVAGVTGNTVLLNIQCNPGETLILRYSGTAAPTAGTYTFTTATGSGNAIAVNLAASPQVTVIGSITTTVVTPASAVYSPSAQSVTLNATVISTSTVTGGTVTFTVASGATTIGSPVSVPVTNGAASAGYTIPADTPVGSYTVIATYSGDATLPASSGSTALSIIAAATSLTWPQPAAITYGTALSGTQLNAATLVPGTFTYSPASGTVLNAGTHTLSVTFTPASANYLPSTGLVSLTVNKAQPIVSLVGGTFTYDGAAHPATVSVKGVLNEDLAPVTLAYVPGGASAPVDAGTYAVTASYAGDGNYNPVSGTATITITAAPQTISFGALADKTYGDAPFTISATATSGLPVAFSASGACTLSGNEVTITAAGSCTITASQPGNTNYAAAVPVSQSFNITKASQMIAFAALPNRVYGDAPFTLTATATSALQVTFAASGNCSAAGDQVTITGAGSCTVTATQTGNGNYEAATPVSQTFAISRASQTITFAALANKTYGDAPFSIGASASSGLAVSFAAVGNCSVAGTQVTITGAGSCTLTASQAGDANYDPAVSVPQSFAISKAAQTINFAALPDKAYGDAPFDVTASATSGLPVNFVVAGDCSITGTQVTIAGAGSCTVTASQPGDANFEAAPAVTHTFAITQAIQTITFTVLPNRTYGDAAFALTANASSGLPVSYAASGQCSVTAGMVTVMGAGSCTITASQAGNGVFGPATDVAQTFAIAKAVLTIKPDDLTRPYGQANPAFTYGFTGFVNGESANVVSGEPYCTSVANESSAAGTYAINCAVGTLAAANYDFLAGTGVITITKTTQTITFGSLPARSYGAAPFNIDAATAAASSGLPLTFAASGPCNATGATIQITGAGTCTVTASQAGDDAYEAGTPVSRSFTITPATLTVTPAEVTRTYGDANPTITAEYAGFVNGDTSAVLTGSPLCSATATPASVVGQYVTQCTQGTLASSNYAFVFATGHIHIARAPLTVAPNPVTRLEGEPNPILTGTITGLKNGDNITATYSTAATISSPPGAYPITATLVDLDGKASNYTVSYVSADLSIEAETGTPDLTISALSISGQAVTGGQVQAIDTVANLGTKRSAESITRFYLSVNAVRDSDDRLLLGMRYVPRVAAGAQSFAEASTALTLPVGIVPGPYYILACADGYGDIDEGTNENNNCRSAAVDIAGPDLRVNAIAYSGTALTGGTIQISETVNNSGPGASAVSVTRFYVSRNATKDLSAIAIKEGRHLAIVPPGETAALGPVAVTVPLRIGPGAYYLIACADGNSDVPENAGAEINNCESTGITIVGPDLHVTSVAVSGNPATGGSFQVSEIVENAGAGAADTSVTRFYISADSIKDAADVPLTGTRPVPVLPSGDSNGGVQTTVTAPLTVAPGSYYLLACADDYQAVPEGDANENDNCGAAAITVAGPDLQVLSVTVNGTPAAGATVQVSETITNSGPAAAGTSVTRFYFSKDNVKDALDTLLAGVRVVAAIPAGNSAPAGPTNVTLPTTVAPGTYYLLACADDNRAVPEGDAENNNCNGTQITLAGADLEVTGFTVTGTPGTGATIQVRDTVLNSGPGKAGASVTRFFLSMNATREPGDTALPGVRSVLALASGASSTPATPVAVTIPMNVAPGSYFLLACADDNRAVQEEDETNNCAATAITVAGADLQVLGVNVAGTAIRGSAVQVTESITNAGAAIANTSTTRFYLSANDVKDSFDTLLAASRSTPSLGAGATFSPATALSLTIPTTAKVGPMFLLTCADASNSVPEGSLGETNNCTAVPITIQ